ncbi:MAG: MGMT family protein [Acidobacteriia bacterium]|nr:MGMT family protein [Terriglobia bacterium]
MQSAIRAAILKIPRGKVSTYGAIARAAGYPRAARQVVWALQQSHGLPWHRVVAAGGRIALPGEFAFEQRLRLEAEGVKFAGKKVRMKEYEFVFAKAAQREKHPAKSLTRRSKPKKRANRRRRST